jgi:membrane-associated phospholipid phosphatase
MTIWQQMDWVLPLRSPFFNGLFELVTLAGYPLFLIMFLCFGYFALGSKRFFHTAMLLMATGLLNSWLKDFGQDARPNTLYALDGRVADSYGWPSGHTQIAVVLWGYLAYTMRQNWVYAAAAIFISLQGFSRLYLGVHDLGDVFWGFVFGVLCLAAYIAVERHDKSRTRLAALSLPQIALALLALQGLYVAFYPAHIGHEAPYWFIGLTTGWLVGRYLRGHEEVQMPGPLFFQLAVAAALTGLSFVLMIVTTRLPRALGDDNALVQYGFGTLFGLAIIGLLPYLVAKANQVFTGQKRYA